jgi:hypothetical protein
MKISGFGAAKFGIAALMMFGVQSAARAADTDTCTAITSVPTTISKPGVYCMTRDLSSAETTGAAILITSGSVVLDLGDHVLSGLQAGTGTLADGIFAENLKNITIRNGTVRGFFGGIFLNQVTSGSSGGHLIENIHAESNRFYGIYAVGDGSIVRRNQALHTGGSSVRGATDSIGITIGGTGSRAIDNDVVDTTAKAVAIGIAVIIGSGDGAIIEGNRISNAAATSVSSGGSSIGIAVDIPDSLVLNNRITGTTNGIDFSFSGKYVNNVTIGVAVPFSGGTDAGSNN